MDNSIHRWYEWRAIYSDSGPDIQCIIRRVNQYSGWHEVFSRVSPRHVHQQKERETLILSNHSIHLQMRKTSAPVLRSEGQGGRVVKVHAYPGLDPRRIAPNIWTTHPAEQRNSWPRVDHVFPCCRCIKVAPQLYRHCLNISIKIPLHISKKDTHT